MMPAYTWTPPPTLASTFSPPPPTACLCSLLLPYLLCAPATYHYSTTVLSPPTPCIYPSLSDGRTMCLRALADGGACCSHRSSFYYRATILA